MDNRRRNISVAITAVAGYNLLRSFKDLTHEESSDDETNICQKVNLFNTRVRIGGNRKHVTRIEGYVSIIIPGYTERQFREHFRMTRNTFENVERTLTPYLVRSAESGRSTLDPQTQLLAILWLLATPDSFRSVSDRFGISKSLLHDSMRRVVAALNDVSDRFIKWPVNDQLNAVKRKFSQIGHLPDVIGAIDGTHIPIPAPKVNSIFYRTRKKQHAITLQAICNANLVFTDCFVGFAGSVHDARIFRNSDLWHAVTTNYNDFFPNNEYIIGDKAYPVLQWCLTPYINKGNMTEAQKNFNEHLSKMRQVIERAFALLKGRFRRLKYLHMNCIDLIPYTILACCVLHNICLEGCEVIEDLEDFICEGFEECDDNDNMGDVIPNRLPNDQRGLTRREYLTALVQNIAP